MATRRGNLDGFLGVQSAGCGQDDDVGIGLRQHAGEVAVSLRAGVSCGCVSCHGVDVADADQFGALRVLAQRREVVLGDSSAAHKRKPDFSINDGGGVVAHIRR